MGQILNNISVDLLRPTQYYMLEETLKDIREHHARGVKAPIVVSKDIMYTDGYNVIDGHHNVTTEYPNSVQVAWLAEHKDDMIPHELFPEIPREKIDDMNSQIRKRFDQVNFYVPTGTNGEEMLSFEQLLEHHYKQI